MDYIFSYWYGVKGIRFSFVKHRFSFFHFWWLDEGLSSFCFEVPYNVFFTLLYSCVLENNFSCGGLFCRWTTGTLQRPSVLVRMVCPLRFPMNTIYVTTLAKDIRNILLSIMNGQYDHHDKSVWATKTFILSGKVMEISCYLFVYSFLFCWAWSIII